MDAPINEPSKLCLSVLTCDRIKIPHLKQTDETCKVMGKDICNWPNKVKMGAVSDSRKVISKSKKGKKPRYHIAFQGATVKSTPTTLTATTPFVREFPELGRSTLKSDVFCTQVFYGFGGGQCDDVPGKPEEHWAILSFCYLIQCYLACCSSMSATNLLSCRKPLNFYECFPDFHTRYQLLGKHTPGGFGRKTRRISSRYQGIPQNGA